MLRNKSFENYSRSTQFRILQFSRNESNDTNDVNNDSDSSSMSSPRNDNLNDVQRIENDVLMDVDNIAGYISADESEHDEFYNASEDENNASEDENSDSSSDENDDSSDDEYDDASDGSFADDQNNSSEDNDASSIDDSSSVTSDNSLINDNDIDLEEGNNEDENLPLYEGARISVAESMLSILALVLRFSVTGVLLANILTLIEMHCPERNNCTTTLYMFKKYFEDLHTPLTRHFYCANCFRNLESGTEQCPGCLESTDNKYFISMSVSAQLHALYKRHGFYNKLQHRFNREKIVQGNIEDIYDGEIYQELSSPGKILSHPNNISFTWYTDGVPIFKSSKFSIWPVYLTINELPYAERFKKENVILAGLWFGDQKPVPNLYLLPLHNEFIQIGNGIEIFTPDLQNSIMVRGIIISGTCDLPAKALFLNMKQYNGKFGCHKCKQSGKRVENVQVYPYRRNLVLRTEAETLRHAELAGERPVYGVKGPTIMSILVYKWIKTTALDSMHCVFVGLTKGLLKLWFDPTHADQPFSISRMVDLIDSKIKNLSLPEFVQRRPRSIKEHLNYWKASELKVFFFYLSIPLLEDVLPREYFDHLKLLVMGIFLLCSSSISEEMINNSNRALNEYVSRFENLYGLRHMTCNLHSLLHLPQIVRELGPLWTYSCFQFEDINGKLKNLVHGSNSAQLQIYFGASLFINTFTLNKELLIEGTKPHAFCKKLLSSTKQMKLQQIGNSTYIVGALSKLPIPNDVQIAILNKGIQGLKYIIFKKLFKNSVVYSSTIYTRSKLTNSTCVQYVLNDELCIGIINFFIRVTNCNCRNVCQCPGTSHYAIVNKYDSETAFPDDIIPHLKVNFIHKIQVVPDEIEIIDIGMLKTVCFLIKNEESKYAAEPVNMSERE